MRGATAMLSTRTFNFVPDAFEAERIQKAARGDWDANGDLSYLNILYDEYRAMWVRGPEEDFDYRRTYDPWGENQKKRN
jgi:hypothetical protein